MSQEIQHRSHSPFTTAEHAQQVKSTPESIQKQIEKCEDSLTEVMHELVSYAYLLRWLGPGADSAENLYGLGVSLDRLSRKVTKTMERLSKIKVTME